VIGATLIEFVTAWPLAFLLGVAVGLGLASRYRIVKARNGEL
jgi:hypothetical protein